MFNAKVLHEFEAARAMCNVLCGLEDMIYAGAEDFSHLIHPSVMISKEGETIEQFAAKVGLQSLYDDGIGDSDALHIAVWMHNQSAVRTLLTLRCNSLLHRNAVGNTAFDNAVICASLESARAILATGQIEEQHISVVNYLGGTTLQTAAENGHVQLIQLLLDHRADVHCPKSHTSKFAGRTALHCASMNCWHDCCKLLLKHGACATTKDAKGCTPLDLVALDGPVLVGNRKPDARVKTRQLLEEAIEEADLRSESQRSESTP